MKKTIIVSGLNSTEYLRALESQTLPYRKQPFIVPLDGAIVSHIDGNCFKLWPRTRCWRVVAGSVESDNERLIISWTSRLPLPILIAYSSFGLFFICLAFSGIVGNNLNKILCAGFFLAFLLGLLFGIWNRGHAALNKIENLLGNIRASEKAGLKLSDLKIYP